MPENAANPDPLDAILAALARLRGRGQRPHDHDPRGRGRGGHGDDHGRAQRGERHGGPHAHGTPWGDGPRGGGEAPARLRLLEALAGGALSVSALGEAIGVDQPRASRLVQQGVERGLLRRDADPDDARRTLIALTDAGRRMSRGFRGQRREALRTALQALSAEEQAEFGRLLAKVADNWR
ncbi:MarR family winged helix-turn-helix transcriptional regulator [uncultured Microbacterium sp.]|uniref:MarR family winged helix-turn-helix transcriptional regulator n=1 Tax=uncultured Microbacterium sp. TaxID=191216 RepID=UPI0025F3B508|nr:MarR family winged helix-turn-helix transcriptional regulator [uncultured Microbacterium sp.]